APSAAARAAVRPASGPARRRLSARRASRRTPPHSDRRRWRSRRARLAARAPRAHVPPLAGAASGRPTRARASCDRPIAATGRCRRLRRRSMPRTSHAARSPPPSPADRRSTPPAIRTDSPNALSPCARAPSRGRNRKSSHGGSRSAWERLSPPETKSALYRKVEGAERETDSSLFAGGDQGLVGVDAAVAVRGVVAGRALVVAVVLDRGLD